MGIQINPRTDYSALFSSMNAQNTRKTNNYSWAFGGGSDSSTGINLSDYASIKNGSYGKLLKTYYAQEKSGSTTKTSEAAKKIIGNSYDATSTNTALAKDTSAISKSASALLESGKDSLFEEKDIQVKDEDGGSSIQKGYDREGIYKAVSSFVKDYNALVDSAAESNNSSVLATAANMTSQTSVYSKALDKVGIKIGEDNKLTVDKETLDKADVSDLKNLFNRSGSWVDTTKGRADIIASMAQNDAQKASGTYASTGLYSNASLLNGSSFSSFV